MLDEYRRVFKGVEVLGVTNVVSTRMTSLRRRQETLK